VDRGPATGCYLLHTTQLREKINTFDDSPFMEPLSTYRTHNSYRNPFNGHSELFLCVQVNPVLVSLAKWIVTWLLSFFFSFFPRGS